MPAALTEFVGKDRRELCLPFPDGLVTEHDTADASSAIRVLREYQRAVVFTFGRLTGVKGPGLILLVPYVQQMVRVDLRTVVLDVPSQDVISRDNVSVKVNAVVYFRVMEPTRR